MCRHTATPRKFCLSATEEASARVTESLDLDPVLPVTCCVSPGIHQELSVRELVGCAIMFSAIILAQFAEKKQENVKEKTTE